MWRIYSHEARGVRLRSTPARLGRSLAGSAASNVQVFVGSVQYLSESKVAAFVDSVLQRGRLASSTTAARTILVKRYAFRHEAETRLLLRLDAANASADIHPYEVDPHEMIDQLMLDPRLDKREAAIVKAEILERTAFKGRVLRSMLYAPPPVLDKQIVENALEVTSASPAAAD
jgi:hypothetical protein